MVKGRIETRYNKAGFYSDDNTSFRLVKGINRAKESRNTAISNSNNLYVCNDVPDRENVVFYLVNGCSGLFLWGVFFKGNCC